MKQILLSAVLLFSWAFTQAQTDTLYNESDTIRERTRIEVSFGNSDFDSTDNLKTRWFTFGLGPNLVHNQGDFSLGTANQISEDFGNLRFGNSTNVEIGIVQQKLNLSKHKLNLQWGLGLDNNKFSFEEDFVIDQDANEYIRTTEGINGSTKKNRLSATYVQVPLMLNYESSTRHYNSIRISAGGFAGLRINSNQKIKFRDRDDNGINGKKKYKESDDFNLENVVYGLKGELGYGPVNLYAKYNLNDLFKEEVGQDLQLLSVGIMLVPF
ncbi:MAG: PorT family protein [Saprospiraceae bacterium]|nr:PorT family protein [Saprospiraceae bacterium]